MSEIKFSVKKQVFISEIKEYAKVNRYTFADFPTLDNKMSVNGFKDSIEGEPKVPCLAEVDLEITIKNSRVKKWDPKKGEEVDAWINEADYLLRKVKFAKVE